MSPGDWVANLKKWSTKQNSEFNPDLVKKFACTQVDDDIQRYQLLDAAEFELISEDSAPYDICRALSHIKFKDACKNSELDKR